MHPPPKSHLTATFNAVAPPASLLEEEQVVVVKGQDLTAVPAGVDPAKWQKFMALRAKRELIAAKDKQKEQKRIEMLKKRIHNKCKFRHP